MYGIFLEHYFGYVIYTLVLIVLVIISLLPFEKRWVFKALFRSAIVLGTAFVFIDQLGNEMKSLIMRGGILTFEPLLNVTLMMAINNILKAIADVAEAIIDGVKSNKKQRSGE